MLQWGLSRLSAGGHRGGFTPTIATALVAAAGGNPWLVSAFLLLIALIALVCTYLAPETFRGDISESEERLGQRPGSVTSG